MTSTEMYETLRAADYALSQVPARITITGIYTLVKDAQVAIQTVMAALPAPPTTDPKPER